MKIIVLKNKLVEALSLIERATGNSPTLPILKNVLFEAKENRLLVSATNLEFAITYTFSGKVIESGGITIPCGLLLGLIKNLTSERITMEVKGKKLFVKTENYTAEIQSQDIKDFPIIPSLSEKGNGFEVTTRSLSEVLGSVISATQFSEIRPEISGILVFREGGVVFVATDGFRLAERHFEGIKSESMEGIKAIIPIRTAEEVLRIFSTIEDSPLSVVFDETQVLFKTKDIEIVSRLIDGAFPDYKAIIPKEVKSEVIIDRQEFLQALRLVSTFSTKINDIKISIGEGGKHIELSSSNSAIGENIYKIAAKIKGDPFSIAFNWRFLIDGLKSVSGDEVFFGINTSDKPALLRSMGDSSLIYVVMPLKI